MHSLFWISCSWRDQCTAVCVFFSISISLPHLHLPLSFHSALSCLSLSLYIYIYIYICSVSLFPSISLSVSCSLIHRGIYNYVCMYVCMHVCMYICMYLCQYVNFVCVCIPCCEIGVFGVNFVIVFRRRPGAFVSVCVCARVKLFCVLVIFVYASGLWRLLKLLAAPSPLPCSPLVVCFLLQVVSFLCAWLGFCSIHLSLFISLSLNLSIYLYL
jgi:hypothetical protein